MTPLYTRITAELLPALIAAMPETCDGPKWNVRNEGVCTFARRTDERQEYLYGPLWPVSAQRQFVTLDDTYDAQFAVVAGNIDATNAGYATLASNEYDLQLVVATFHRYPTLMSRIQKALNDLYGVQVLSINTDTLRNAARFVQPDSDSRGLDPERLIFFVNIKYIINLTVTDAELAAFE